MKINHLRKQKLPAIILALALLLGTASPVPSATAAHTDIHIETAPTGTSILTQNGGTVVTTFSPAMGPTMTASTTGSATAYYGIHAVSATSSADVFWRITVSHATSTLVAGMVSITEKGWFDASGNAVADSPYVPTVLAGDLVLTGNSGWSIAPGDDFTNVDEISFSSLAPTGDYTITRELIDVATGAVIDAPFVAAVTLVAPAGPDITPPAAPIAITFPACATTSPVTIEGTAEAGATITFSGGGLGTSTATTTATGGTFSALIDLILGALNSIGITATDPDGNVSATTTISIDTSTTTPTITLIGDANMTVFTSNPFVDPGVIATGGVATTSGTVDISAPGTFTLTYSVTSCGGTATTTRVVTVLGASSGGGGGGGGSSAAPTTAGVTGGSVTTDTSAAVTSPITSFGIPQVLGLNTFFVPGIPNTGAGGDAGLNLGLILGSLGLASLGCFILRKRNA